MVATVEGKEALDVLYQFIKDWFVYIESKEEFEVSHKSFLNQFKSTRDKIGEHTCIIVDKLVSTLLSKNTRLFHYNFKGKSTLGFKGDSIVESSFNVTKRNNITVNSRSHIDKTGIAIVEQNEEKKNRLNSDQCTIAGKRVMWSRCMVKDVLTKYALGLFCKNFDRRLDYLPLSLNQTEWLVVHKNFFDNTVNAGKSPKFKRVRKVKMDDQGFMNCSCGRTNEYLLPCSHICSVVKQEGYFGPDQFHIRWHKDFCYYFGTDFGTKLNSSKIDLLGEMLAETRKNHFNVLGEYRGCFFGRSIFLAEIRSGRVHFDMEESNKKYVCEVYEKNLVEPMFFDYDIPEETETTLMSEGEDGKNDDSFSILTQEEYKLKNNDKVVRKKVDGKDAYHLTYPLYEESLRSIRNEEDADQLRILLLGFIHDSIQNKGNHSSSVGETVLLNENIRQTAKIEKRHKFLYERI